MNDDGGERTARPKRFRGRLVLGVLVLALIAGGVTGGVVIFTTLSDQIEDQEHALASFRRQQDDVNEEQASLLRATVTAAHGLEGRIASVAQDLEDLRYDTIGFSGALGDTLQSQIDDLASDVAAIDSYARSLNSTLSQLQWDVDSVDRCLRSLRFREVFGGGLAASC